MEAFFAAGPDEGERSARGHRILGELPHLEAVELSFEPPWEGVDPHSHADHTDSFYVLEGEVEFLVNGEWRRGGPGTFASVPPGVEHGFRIPAGGGRIRILNIHAPNTGWVDGLRPR
ncbi:MAG TPA: cupin domain-containing protein [Gaiellaceae bacterium]|nr:cupin domain-containing protein [Gaiellaceae bacterium]